jgi:molybdopterin adenylyltransferase
MIKIGILTISDKGSKGQREDKSGEAIREGVSHIASKVVKYEIVPDEKSIIAGKLAAWADSGEVDVILTTGGTGLRQRRNCLIINMPGSVKAVKECLEAIIEAIPHAVEIIKGEVTEHLTQDAGIK